MKSSNLLIEHQCPQCGAPATLEETDHLFSCEFCRVKSYLLSRVFRYVLPHNAPSNKELVFLPYWRFKGMLFFCISNGIKQKIVDVSQQGISSPLFPPSLSCDLHKNETLPMCRSSCINMFEICGFPEQEISRDEDDEGNA